MNINNVNEYISNISKYINNAKDCHSVHAYFNCSAKKFLAYCISSAQNVSFLTVL